MVTECEMRTFVVDGDSVGSLIDPQESPVARAHFRVYRVFLVNNLNFKLSFKATRTRMISILLHRNMN